MPSAYADPPYPPVWPLVFSANEVYGKDTVNVNQSFVRGDTFVMTCVAILSQSNTPLDLTGCTLTLTARYQVTDTSAVFTLTSPSSGITIVNAAGGIFEVTIPASATASVPLTRTVLQFDIQYALSSTRYTLTRGTFTILPDVTAT